MKYCTKCDTYNPESFFTKNNLNKDKLNSWCKECTRRSGKEGYRRTRTRRSQKIAEYQRTPRGRKVIVGAVKKWMTQNTKKSFAHVVVQLAVRRGIIKPEACQMCGKISPVHAHHTDYDRPYDVMWLCPQHHKDQHAKEDIINKL